MDLQLTGKRALVTGSSSGIGEAIARTLAREGATVVVHGRNRERTEAVAGSIREAGGIAHIALGDLSTDEGADAVVDVVHRALNGVDILINNAGGAEGLKPWVDTSAQDWAQVYNLNVVSGIRLLQRLLPAMRQTGWGRIIQISGGLAVQPWPNGADYSAAKAAMNSMTVALAKELAGTGITVNTLSPGPILTAGLEARLRGIAAELGWKTDTWEEIEARVSIELIPNPSRRIGRVEEVADAVAFLASPRAGYINGANLRVDGGFVTAMN